ncbi:MAG: hypothetical protein KDB14_07535 [Planctomycetales bacterium]|nr:hypothetical protein [Planctomycetales bacterium]
MRTFNSIQLTSFGAIAMLGVGFALHAQDAPATKQADEITDASQIRTLDDVRRLGPSHPPSPRLVRDSVDPTTGAATYVVDRKAAARTSEDPRNAAMQRIRQLQVRLALPDADRAKIEGELKAALSDYFVADMRHRVRELDDIKAKLIETEAKLQKRLDNHQQAVDLQLEIMLREAAGLGFFNPDDAAANASPNVTFRPVPGRPGAYLRVEKNDALGIDNITVVDPDAKASKGPIPRPKARTTPRPQTPSPARQDN